MQIIGCYVKLYPLGMLSDSRLGPPAMFKAATETRKSQIHLERRYKNKQLSLCFWVYVCGGE